MRVYIVVEPGDTSFQAALLIRVIRGILGPGKIYLASANKRPAKKDTAAKRYAQIKKDTAQFL